MKVRAPRPADAAGIARVHVRAWQEGYKNGLMPDHFLAGLSIDDRTEMWEGILAREVRPRSGRFVSVDESGSITGQIMVGPAEGDPEASTGEVYSLNVDPDYWGRGHGSRLLTTGANALREAGFVEAVLWVHTGSRRSRRFYEHNGWQADGTERTVEVLGAAAPESRYHLDLSDS